MQGLTRRATIAALLGSGAAVGALAVGLRINDEEGYVRSIVERVVGPFKMADDQYAAFVDDLEIGQGWRNNARLGSFILLSVAGGALVPYAPGDIGNKYQQFERRVVTTFLTRTDYLQIDPATQEVSFVGANGCSNPFANFDMD